MMRVQKKQVALPDRTDLSFQRCDGPYAVTNGPAISPDGRCVSR
ncbi:MAG: hypothetical protein CM1200mP18_05560 [Gammaproteobacteria bacterium]|nr:MAG: hypothetical protein CM1200mP18_05560 [Gammaproteobacteria bacterium]